MDTLPCDFQTDSTTLAGKTVVITGAASELGSSVVYGAAQSGATTIMIDRREKDMAALYDEICANQWPEPMLVEFDIRKANYTDIERLGIALSQQFTQLDGLVHCANWGVPLTPIQHINIETWENILANSLTKPMLITKALIPLLEASGAGSIIFTALDAGRKGRAYWGGIATAFAGIENLTEILSCELESINIRTNSFDPGKVKTQFRKKCYPGETADQLRDANDQDIVRRYLYLLSDESGHINGARFGIPPIEAE